MIELETWDLSSLIFIAPTPYGVTSVPYWVIILSWEEVKYCDRRVDTAFSPQNLNQRSMGCTGMPILPYSGGFAAMLGRYRGHCPSA